MSRRPHGSLLASHRSVQPDPPPVPPERPQPEDCCNSGCDRCVFTLYEEALEAYREALREWELRQQRKPARRTR